MSISLRSMTLDDDLREGKGEPSTMLYIWEWINDKTTWQMGHQNSNQITDK